MISFTDVFYGGKGLFQRMIQPLCKKYDLTDSQIAILLFLDDEESGDTATDIVERLRLRKSVVSMALKDLQGRDYISSMYHEGNRRSLHLKLEDKAREIVKEAKDIQSEHRGILTDGFSSRDAKMLTDLLEKMNDNIRKCRI